MSIKTHRHRDYIRIGNLIIVRKWSDRIAYACDEDIFEEDLDFTCESSEFIIMNPTPMP